MGEKIKIDLVVAQTIINKKQSAWTGSFSPFLQEVANDYNTQLGTSIDWQNFRARINGGKLTCNIKSRTKGSPISDEHKKKFFEGRERAKDNPVQPKTISSNNQKANARLIELCGEKYPNLTERVLKGSLASAVKLHCIMCVCGEKKEITNCIVYSCALHSHRPFQKEEKEQANNIL